MTRWHVTAAGKSGVQSTNQQGESAGYRGIFRRPHPSPPPLRICHSTREVLHPEATGSAPIQPELEAAMVELVSGLLPALDPWARH